MHQLVVLPFRGTLTGWRDGLTRTSHSSTKEKADSFLCGGILLYPVHTGDPQLEGSSEGLESPCGELTGSLAYLLQCAIAVKKSKAS